MSIFNPLAVEEAFMLLCDPAVDVDPPKVKGP